MGGIPFLPPTASTVASELNILGTALIVVTVAVLGLVVVLMLVFCIRYRASRPEANRSNPTKKSWRWEISWTAASFIVFLGLYAWGADLYLREHRPPRDAHDIYVVAKQWMWKIEHIDGQREIDALHVAVDRPVRLVMTSEDVIHGFYIPAFRVKQDVLPGRYLTLWFTPTKVGSYHLYCSQFCGTDHAGMGGFVTVMTAGDYQKWLADNAIAGTLAEQGGTIYRRLGCSGCHGAGSTVKAPRLDGLFGHRVIMRSGAVTMADDGYIRDAILEPGKNPPAGYPPVMPSFAGQLNEEDVVALVAYVKSLADTRAAP
ncbi:MAG TPA: cytochrome c oxidase subunit II [Stellaceae bacterium]|jgi:cytochrome c oxidase subunit 2|nr:cytochrome c oxidase subunit II [Stellaceae bacterium]